MGDPKDPDIERVIRKMSIIHDPLRLASCNRRRTNPNAKTIEKIILTMKKTKKAIFTHKGDWDKCEPSFSQLLSKMETMSMNEV